MDNTTFSFVIVVASPRVRSRRRALTAELAPTALVLGLLGCGGPPPITGEVVREELRSEFVGDTYRLLVRLPPGYDEAPDRRYPVVYQLDATSFGPQFDLTAGLASELAGEGVIPETIVVGVGYPYDDETPNDARGRWRDYTTVRSDGSPGGAEAFLRFLSEELIPQIDERYRTAPGEGRALFGHSLGGFFALYAMLRSLGATSPPFEAYVAADPSLAHDDNRLLFLEQELADGAGASGFALRLTIARYNGAVQRLYFEELSRRLGRDLPELRFEGEALETDHGGVIEPSFRQGLLFVLGGGES